MLTFAPGDDLRYLLTIVTIFSLSSVAAQINKSDRIEVAVFLAFDCPISQKYIPTLNKWYEQYKDNTFIEWVFVVPGSASPEIQQEFVKEYSVQFPIRMDPKYALVKSYAASVTPEVVIRTENVVYRGAIDNWFYDLGQYRQSVTETYAADALRAVLLGEVPSIRQTDAIGCPIPKRSKKSKSH